jgi:hypothetical protein
MPFEDLAPRSADTTGVAATTRGGSGGQASPPPPQPPIQADDDVIRIDDLVPRENPKGGKKIILGEVISDA